MSHSSFRFACIFLSLFSVKQGVATADFVLSPIASAQFDPSYGDGQLHPLPPDFATVRQRFTGPGGDGLTFFKFDIRNLGLGVKGVQISNATLSLHHSATESNTPADYVSHFFVLTSGYAQGWTFSEAQLDNWSATDPTPYPGDVNEFHLASTVLDFTMPALSYLSYSSDVSQQQSLAQFINADTNGFLTLSILGSGTPSNYPFDWRSFGFDTIRLTIPNSVPEPSSTGLFLLGVGSLVGAGCVRPRIR